MREDENETGEEIKYIEAQQILWGTQYTKIGGFVEAKEDRGVCLTIPFEEEVKNGKRFFVLTTRNYIDYNEIGQAGFIDTRFVKIEHK